MRSSLCQGYEDGRKVGYQNSITNKIPLDKIRALYKDSENGNAGEYTRGWDNALNAVMQLIRQPRDGKMQEAFPEIAKLIDAHKAEGNERGNYAGR